MNRSSIKKKSLQEYRESMTEAKQCSQCGGTASQADGICINCWYPQERAPTAVRNKAKKK